MAPDTTSAGTPATPAPVTPPPVDPLVENETLEDPALDRNDVDPLTGERVDPLTGEVELGEDPAADLNDDDLAGTPAVVRPTPPPGPQGTVASATQSVDNPAAVPTAPQTPVGETKAIDHQSALDQAQRELEDLHSRVSRLEQRFDLLETEHLQGQQATARAADQTPENSEYQCLECQTVIRAIHPSKWWPAYGPIECPNHPGRPELMRNLEIAAQAAEEPTPATQTAPGRQPITVVPGTPADLSTTGTVGSVPPPPPSATTLPPTIVSGPQGAYDPHDTPNLGEGTAGNELAGSTVEPAPGANNPVPQSEQAPLPAPAL